MPKADKKQMEILISAYTMHKLRKLYFEGDPNFYSYYEYESDKLDKGQKLQIMEMMASPKMPTQDEDKPLKKEDG